MRKKPYVIRDIHCSLNGDGRLVNLVTTDGSKPARWPYSLEYRADDPKDKKKSKVFTAVLTKPDGLRVFSRVANNPDGTRSEAEGRIIIDANGGEVYKIDSLRNSLSERTPWPSPCAKSSTAKQPNSSTA